MRAEGFQAQRQPNDSPSPIGSLGEPDDIAYPILFLASDEAKYITGQTLVVNGAQTLPESISAV